MRQVSPALNISLYFFMKRSKHRNVVTLFVHHGDGDGDVTKLKLSNIKNRVVASDIRYATCSPLIQFWHIADWEEIFGLRVGLLLV